MKFLSLVIFVVFLAWSWQGYKHANDIPVVVHYNLQNELRSFIADYVSKNVPSAENIQFHRFWTEPTETSEVKAIFEYSFDSKGEGGEVSTTRLKGFAFLSPDGGLDQWSLNRVEVNNQVIDFKSGSVVSPKSEQ